MTKNSRSTSHLVMLLVLLAAIPVGLYLVKGVVKFFSGASTVTANFYISPATVNMPPSSTYTLFLNSQTAQTGFVKVDVVFNQSLMQLTALPTTTTALGTIISETSVATANSTGHEIIVLGLTPGAAAPVGAFQVAKLPFAVSSTAPTTSSVTSISVNLANSQVVDLTSTSLALSQTPSNISLYPGASPVSTPKPSSIPAPTPTPFRSTPSPTPVSGSSTITIFAAGNPLGGVYPTIALSIKDQQVAQYPNVHGNPSTPVYQQFVYVSPVKVNASDIKVSFLNFDYNTSEARNVRIDKVVVDGVAYESENPSTYSLGSWSTVAGCSGGYKMSEWLQCNGYFAYAQGQGAPVPTTGNLALNKAVKVSSIESSLLAGANAVDGNTSSRWASQLPGRDPEWISVDLGATYNISRVTLNWEVAYASTYLIQVSDDATNWTTIYSTDQGRGGTESLNLSGAGRFVRMYGRRRGTEWGYSLYEFQIFGSSAQTPSPTPLPTSIPTPTSLPTSIPTPTSLPTSVPTTAGACSPVDATISAPFVNNGVGTFCWRSTNLGYYIDSWDLVKLSINGVDFTHKYTPLGSYPPKINGYWYVVYNSTVPWGHFEAK